jgi:hypothetical protein
MQHIEDSALAYLDNISAVPVVRVRISDLSDADSPRLHGEKQDHIRILAESPAVLPPIIVHRPSMRVIDGMHRLSAAKLRGEAEIDARFFDGDEAFSFVLAVRANVLHGLPLALTDRKTAAARIIEAHPQWSDRLIASVTGLSPKTAAGIRSRSIEKKGDLDARVGRDGRIRPVDNADGRQVAARLISENPQMSLRMIAQEAGISHTTVRDVRDRLNSGKNAVPSGRDESSETFLQDGVGKRLTPQASEVGKSPSDLSFTLEALRADPAFRGSEAGRTLLRMLSSFRVIEEHTMQLTDAIPAHCVDRVVKISYECAKAWQYFAECVELQGGSLDRKGT